MVNKFAYVLLYKLYTSCYSPIRSSCVVMFPHDAFLHTKCFTQIVYVFSEKLSQPLQAVLNYSEAEKTVSTKSFSILFLIRHIVIFCVEGHKNVFISDCTVFFKPRDPLCTLLLESSLPVHIQTALVEAVIQF